MKITDIKLRQSKENKGKLKAYADITLEDCLVIHNAKVIGGKKGLIVCFPNSKKGNKYVDIVHPVTAEFRKYITDEVVAKYKELNK